MALYITAILSDGIFYHLPGGCLKRKKIWTIKSLMYKFILSCQAQTVKIDQRRFLIFGGRAGVIKSDRLRAQAAQDLSFKV